MLASKSLPEHRLPAFYLLDSICKNGGDPFPSMWAPHILRLFADAYVLVDATVRAKMQSMARTWQHAGPGQRPLFGPEVQTQVESFLASQPLQSDNPLSYRIGQQLDLAKEEVKTAPTADLSLRLEALIGLKQVVDKGDVVPSDMRKIEAQVAVLEKVNPPPAAVISPVSTTPETDALPAGGTPPVFPVPVVSTAAAPAPVAPNDLFSKLLKSGLLSKVSAPASANPPTAITAALPPPPVMGTDDQDDRYTREIMSMVIPWNTHDLLLPHWPEVGRIGVEELPLPCKQCGRRFPNGHVGQESLRKHLDWHFRQNKSVKESIVRGQSRIWFPHLAEFITGGADDDAVTHQHGVSEAESNRLTAEKEAELRRLYVPAPADPAVATLPCVICREPFKSEYNEDEEEWVWYNTLLKGGTYIHATCEVSQRTLSSTVQRNASDPPKLERPFRGKDATPEPANLERLRDALKATQPVAGTHPIQVLGKRSCSEVEAGAGSPPLEDDAPYDPLVDADLSGLEPPPPKRRAL